MFFIVPITVPYNCKIDENTFNPLLLLLPPLLLSVLLGCEIFLIKLPINLAGTPVNKSIQSKMKEIILVLVNKIIFVAMANILPVNNVSIVSWNGNTHESPRWLINGATASKKYDSITQISRRIRRSKLDIMGPYSVTFSDPINKAV